MLRALQAPSSKPEISAGPPTLYETTMTTQSHAVLYQLDGRLFLGPERKTDKCAEVSVSPFEGATVLGVVSLLPEPMLGREFAERREVPEVMP